MEKENWLLEETLLHEKYQIKKVLGQGGFGITYLAYDQTLQQNVAIKEYFPVKIVRRLGNTLRKGQGEYELSATAMVYPQNGQEEKYLNGMQNFLEEAQVLFGKFDVEGLAAVKDYFEENGTAYIVMEYLSGPTLQEYEKEHKGKISEKQAEILLEPVINALAYIHSIGIVHCDISPDNLIFNKEGQLKLIDFGAARDYTEFGEKSLSIVLKPGYAPPEQYQTHGVQGPWTDIYALCATMYKCITGENPPDAIDRLVDDHLKKISAFGFTVSPQIEEAIIKGMSVAAKDRYQNVGDFCEDLYGGYEERSVSEAEESQSQVEPETAEQSVEDKADMLKDEVPQEKYSTTEAVLENENLISEELSENAGLTSEENEAEAGIESETSNAGNKVPEQILEKERDSTTPEKEGLSDNRGKEETKKIQKKNKYFLPIIGMLILLGITGFFVYNKSEYKVGKTIEFGNYPQDKDGTEKPIEWIVMKKEGNQVLLLSKYVLDAKPYNEEFEDVTWETSDIRQWLNNEFYTTAFNKAEKAKIQTSLIKNEDNSKYGTNGGNDTEDKVFLLSEKETETLFSNKEERIAKATEYATKSGVYVNEEKAAWWWLRSPGDNSKNAAEVWNYGWVGRSGDDVDCSNDGVRPALHLNLQS